jgi:ParB-like chromosome segregation protein Spo0J
MSKMVLGKGLSALLQRTTVEQPPPVSEPRKDDSEQTNVIASIELDRIRPNPFQPRMDFNVEAQEELKRSIREKGVIQPVTQIQLSLSREDISMGHARALITLHNEAIQLRIWHRIIRQGLSVRKVEDLTRTIGNKMSVPRKDTVSAPSSSDGGIRTIESRLRHTLGTKVGIKPHPTGKGEITIEYYSSDDLDRIVDMITENDKRN